MVIRTEKLTNYTKIDNNYLEDKNISLKAKGLLTLMLSLRDNWNYNYKLYRLYPKEYKELISIFEKLTFIEKKDILAELFLTLEHDELLPDNIDGYEIAKRIIHYYVLKTKLLFENLFYFKWWFRVILSFWGI